MERLGAELSRIERFDDAVELVCQAARELGVASATVVLHRGGEMPAVTPHPFPADDRLSLPVIGPRGWFATIVCLGAPPAVERDLGMLAMYLSVWCTDRGIGTAPANDVLTPRQHEIAQLAAIGRTNAEIALCLGISVNTVKARLKEVFERLEVSNRTELANVLRRPPTDPAHA